MRNMQGTFDDGRGASGLNSLATVMRMTTRYGTGTPRGTRPPRLTGKRSRLTDPRLVASGGKVASGLPFKILPARPTIALGPPAVGRETVVVTSTPARPTRPPLVVSSPRRLSKAARIRHRRQFVNWLQRWAPQLYADAKKHADVAQAREGTLDGLAGWWESFNDFASNVGGKYLQFRTQKDILDAQMERMRQGLPPLQTGEYAPTFAVKPDPETTAEITGAIGAGFAKVLPWAAAGLGLFFLLGRKKR